jgi:hypothetical protein
MAKIRLIIEITGTPKAAQALAEEISDAADCRFEDATMDDKPLSFLRSWTVKPNKDGVFQ